MSQHLRHLTDWEPSMQAQVVVPVAGTNTTKSYNVIIKRNDPIYRIISVINTVSLVAGVLMVAATFAFVAYAVFTMMDADNVLTYIRDQNH